MAAPPRRGDAMAAAEPASSGQQAPQGQGQGQRPQPQPSQAQPPQQPPPPQLGGGGGGSSRHEKSLGLLTTKFVSLLQEAKDGVLDLKAVSAGGGDGGGLSCPRPPEKPTPLKRGVGRRGVGAPRGDRATPPRARAMWPVPRPTTPGWGRDEGPGGPDRPHDQWGPAQRRALDKEPSTWSAPSWLLLAQEPEGARVS